jgi:adenylylsulfate kinase-like enzyme
MATTGRSR